MDTRCGYDVDTLIVYDSHTPQKRIIEAAAKATADGMRVRVQRVGETAVRSREMIDLCGEGKA